MDAAGIDNRFSYHPPAGEKVVAHQEVRAQCAALAHFLDSDVRIPESREKSLAITKLEEVMFWANAAIARN